MDHGVHAVTNGSVWQWLKRSTDAKLGAVWMLLSLPWLSGIRSIPFDAVQQFFPAVSFAAAQFRQLAAPWWNPYLYGGYPQLADPQMMTLQPTMVVPMMLAPTSLHWFGFVVMLHVLLAGLGALRVARHYQLQQLPQLLFAVVIMFGGVAASRLQHTPMIITYCMLPWLWLALSRLRKEQHWADAVLAGIVGGLCALQLTQVTYFVIVGCIAYATGAVALAGKRRWLLVLQLALVALLACLISAPQWLSTLAYLGETNRIQMSLDAAADGALHWQSVVTVLSGGFFSQGRGESWAFGDITTDYLYFGAAPLALWLLWGGQVVRNQPGRARLALLVLVGAVVFAVGRTTLLFPWLFSWLPGLDLFRRPSDALFLTVPAAAWLAAQAMQQALRDRQLVPHWPSIIVVGVLLLLACGLAWSNRRPLGLLWILVTVLLGAMVVRQMRLPVVKAGAVIGLIILDMLLFNISTKFNSLSMKRQDMASERAGRGHEAYRFLVVKQSDGIPERAAVFGIDLLTNGAAVHGLALVNGYNPLQDMAYLTMVGMPESPMGDVGSKRATEWAPDFHAPVYDLLGLHWILASMPFEGAKPIGPSLQVLERDTILPRLLNPRTVKRHAGRYPPAVEFNQTNFTDTLWLPMEAATTCPDVESGRAEMVVRRYEASKMTLHVKAESPAWVVINEINAPGWVAEVADMRLPVQQGNGLFRAVCVPAGEHELMLRYSPLQLWRVGLLERSRGDG